LEELNEYGGKYVEVRVCKHLFHRECMLEWFEHRNTCPLCRKIIFRFNHRPTLNEQAAYAEIMP